MTEAFSLSNASAKVVVAGADAAMPNKLVPEDPGNGSQVSKVLRSRWSFLPLDHSVRLPEGFFGLSRHTWCGSDTAAEGAVPPQLRFWGYSCVKAHYSTPLKENALHLSSSRAFLRTRAQPHSQV